MREKAIEEIVSIAGNYRQGEIAPFNQAHVEKWVAQFPVTESQQAAILCEMAHMLRSYYISKDMARDALGRFFRRLYEDKAVGGSLAGINFLRTQEAGKSQAEMLLLADEILQDEYGLKTGDCGGSDVYVYIDDVIYSGNRWRYDIKNAMQQLPAGVRPNLISLHLCWHNGGATYARPYVEGSVKARGGQVLKYYRLRVLNNDRAGKEPLDIIWPQATTSPPVKQFVKHSEALRLSKGWGHRPMFRSDQAVSPDLFTAGEHQLLVEQAFLAVGAKLFCNAQNPAPSVRPMGFEVLSTLGFGTPVVTWRNIANNCPLALWYGNPAYGASHPLGQWYPLFQRKV